MIDILVASAVICANLSIGTAHAIIGGTNARPGEFPSMLGLGLQSSGQLVCGAVLISEGNGDQAPKALTAAHCLEDVDVQDISIWGGSTKAEGGDRVRVLDAYSHPEYESNGVDIAVLVLDRTPKGSSSADLAKTAPPPGKEITATGWGQIYREDGRLSLNLKKVELPIRETAQCISDPSKFFLCALGSNDKGTYHGDSGGPWFDSDGRLVGITNRQFLDPEQQIGANVSAFGGWISNPVKSLRISTSAISAGKNGDYVYAASSFPNSVRVIDAKTKTLKMTIPLRSSPRSIALSPDEATLYVSESVSGKKGTLSSFNTNTGSEIGEPIEIAELSSTMSAGPNGLVYVGDDGDETISVVNTNKRTVVTGEYGSVERPTAIAVSGAFAYVVDGNNGLVKKVDENGKVSGSVDVGGDFLSSIAVDSSGLAVVADELGNAVRFFSVKDDSPAGDWISVAESPVGVAVEDGKAYVACKIGKSLSVVDGTTGEIFSVVVAGEPSNVVRARNASYVSSNAGLFVFN
ncbi:trypsin-like serine protease (plasmid) [Streptomyces sp. JL4002]|uniref:trypsin-like serine protease n=1 Tax=Streptomyces sp. JL4002 TaxID=3404781 RepID=UPI003B282617